MVKKNLKKIEILLVALMLCFAFCIRAFHFGSTPIGIHQDEAMAAVDAKALADYGTDRFGMKYPVHFTAWIGGQMSVLLSYCMIPFIKFLGFSTYSIRLPMLFVSVIGLLALYLFTRNVCGKRTAFICLLLGAICPWHYMQSRWSFDCNMFPHFFLFGCCFLSYGLRKKACLYISMVFFGLCSYCYGIANYSVPLFLIGLAIYFVYKKLINIKELIACIVVYILIALPEFLTMLINLMKWDTIETAFFTIPYFPYSSRSKDILFFDFSWEMLWNNIMWTIRTTLLNGDKSVTNVIASIGPIYSITTLFFVLGFGVWISKSKRAKDEYQKTQYILILAWLLMSLWVGVVTRSVTINRINIVFYIILVVASMGIEWCIGKCKLLIVPIVAGYGTLAIVFAFSYFGEWSDLSRIYYYESYLNALNYAKTISCDYYFITPDPQGGNLRSLGEILTLYSHEIDAHYYQGLTNEQDGKMVLPYEERYNFTNITEEVIEENKDKDRTVVYVVNRDEISNLSIDNCEIESFYNEYFVFTN